MTWEPPGPQGPFIEYGARHTAYGPQMPPPGAGPQPGWGAPGVNAPPLSLWEAIKQLPRQYWRIVTRPGTATFAYEVPNARWDIIWVQILGLSLISAILSTLAWLIIATILSAWLSTIPTVSGEPHPGASLGAFFFLPAPAIGAAVFLFGLGGFFLGQGITYLLAKAFGGQGSFMVQAYTGLLFQVPINLVTVALSVIPLVGSVGGIVGIYAYFLQYFQLTVVHRLTTGKAIAVIVIPVAAATLLAFILVLIYYVIIFSTLGTLHPTPTP
ncbi:MAG TPA: YIP1 family protein [Ktedonobacterales bacterium]|nr:YIP1 family protein [Ktedonobacterales bacterium]